MENLNATLSQTLESHLCATLRRLADRIEKNSHAVPLILAFTEADKSQCFINARSSDAVLLVHDLESSVRQGREEERLSRLTVRATLPRSEPQYADPQYADPQYADHADHADHDHEVADRTYAEPGEPADAA